MDIINAVLLRNQHSHQGVVDVLGIVWWLHVRVVPEVIKTGFNQHMPGMLPMELILP